jgi:large subunit ribosomal protein L6
MSRIGRSPIPSLRGHRHPEREHGDGQGPPGRARRAFPAAITIRQDGDVWWSSGPDDERQNRALHGLTRSLVANMVTGVTEGFSKELEIVGVGYRAVPRAPAPSSWPSASRHPVNVDAPDGITFEVPSPTRIIVKGIDKEKVGQVAADIRKLRKPEPYKGKGVRYAGERVVRKAGKAAK